MKSKLIERLIEKVLADEVIEESGIEGPWEIGKAYLIRTVTYHQVGILKDIQGDFLIFKDASWVADSGRFMQAIKNGTLNEVEPVGKAYINIKSVTDFFPWVHALPKEQK